MGIIFRVRSNPILRNVLGGMSALLLCVVFMASTDPSNVSLAALLVPFLLLGVALFGLINGVLIGVFSPVVSAKIRRFTAIMGSFVFVTMLLLQSLNQFTARDMLILLVLVMTLGLYVTRVDIGSK